MAEHSTHSEHVVSMKTNVIVWLILMALMTLTAVLSTVAMGTAMNTLVALIIATIKAALVLLFFMHLKYESYKLSAVVFGAGLFWLFILFSLDLTDYLTRTTLGVPGH
jgi:cytochrome c oxidase subunit 4